MPLPRKKDEGGTGAPVLNILSAHVRLFDVEEHTEPYTRTRKSDGATFMLDPRLSCTVEVVDDGADGTHNGCTFFEGFRYKQDKKGNWFNQRNSKLGELSNVVKPGYFEDPTIPLLEASDLESFEMLCRIKPNMNPAGQVTGSTIEWDTMRPLPDKKAPRPVTDPPTREADATPDEDEWEDIPF
jgi:hypothetical protein